jgi:hypothetical protein
VTLDLNRPEHREELAEACAMRANNPATADRMLATARGIASTGATPSPAFAAHVALSSPSACAVLVRAMLEGCGVDAREFSDVDVEDDDDVVLVRCDAWRAIAGVYVMLPGANRAVHIRNVPSLILALLACATREAALAALRKAGR